MSHIVQCPKARATWFSSSLASGLIRYQVSKCRTSSQPLAAFGRSPNCTNLAYFLAKIGKLVVPNYLQELNSNILEYLSSFLSLSDYSRFGAVCQNWFSVAKQKRHPPRQLPWLVMGEDDATHKRKFYSIDEKKHYLIDIPELRGQRLCGSSYG
ncbi:F-box protein [Carex littledalei]|uniref:F-box protein n=1 Tax=Carex littledalei TaxID=544730 RepID=A0A833VD60_9POAL|nr:F-box protein [Carex littledalei]